MDPQVQASFIPKKPLDTGGRSRGGVGLLFLIVLLIFIASLIAAGGAFLYKQLLQKQLADKSHDLEVAQGAYDPSTIEDLVRLDTRITEAQKLFAKHLAASSVFSFLSNQTLERVVFTTFLLEMSDAGTADITMGGVADSFSTLALQSDQFGNNKMLKDVVFSGISVGEGGKVQFSVKATINPALLLYSNALSGGTAVPTVLPAATTTTQ